MRGFSRVAAKDSSAAPRLLLVLFLVLIGCQRTSGIPLQGMWSGTVELKEGKVLPFQMNLDFSGAKPAGYFLNGNEKTPIPEIAREGDSVILGFSEYSAEVRATWDGARLNGTYNRIRSSGTTSLKFTAAPGAASETPASGALPAGNFQVIFQGEDKVDDTTLAKFWSKDGSVYGTLIAPDGDYGLLAGRPAGNRIQLNRFTGWQATVIELENSGGAWSGKFYAASNDKPRSFILQPRAGLSLAPAAAQQTAMKNPNAEFVFSGMSLSGETVRNTDDRFKGKALIVDIMGTWCHNCLDESPVLQQLQQKFGKDGFEVVGLSFEISDDPALAKKNLQLYKDRFGLTYTLLFCGSLDDANVMKQIHSQLDNFFAYPTAIFIDKNHKVRSVHSGFKGPGTGEEFQTQIREFQELTHKLIVE